MGFLHKRLSLSAGQSVVVTIDKQANVMLTDDLNFARYKKGEGGFKYYQGLVTTSPARLTPPHAGNWHVTIDFG
jgi:hypothetical protein